MAPEYLRVSDAATQARSTLLGGVLLGAYGSTVGVCGTSGSLFKRDVLGKEVEVWLPPRDLEDRKPEMEYKALKAEPSSCLMRPSVYHHYTSVSVRETNEAHTTRVRRAGLHFCEGRPK